MNKALKYIKYESSEEPKHHKRLFKLLSILNFYTKNQIKYRQSKLLIKLNEFLSKENLKPITLRTLQNDLKFLFKNNIITKYSIKLGKYKGTYSRYIPSKNAVQKLKDSLDSKDKIQEKDINIEYNLNKKNLTIRQYTDSLGNNSAKKFRKEFHKKFRLYNNNTITNNYIKGIENLVKTKTLKYLNLKERKQKEKEKELFKMQYKKFVDSVEVQYGFRGDEICF